MNYKTEYPKAYSELSKYKLFLKQLEDYKIEIKSLSDDLHNLCATNNLEERTSGGNQMCPQDVILDKIIDVEELWLAKLKQADKYKEQILKKINSLPSVYSEILYLRFIKNEKSMQKISWHLNFSYNYCFDIMRRALESYERSELCINVGDVEKN